MRALQPPQLRKRLTVQTFLPFASYRQCAESLGRLRLGKQRVEVLQILRVLTGESAGWRSHPVVKAWAGCERHLAEYGIAMCDEWTNRGYKDSTKEKIERFLDVDGNDYPPPFVTNPRVHSAYRALLVGKKPEHYRDRLGWTEEPIDQFDYSLLQSD